MDRIGKFDVIAQVGEGTTARVYLAHDPFSDREVAVKYIEPKILSDPRQGRLYRQILRSEASLAGRLNHPHIARIFDAIVTDSEAYVVMEYVPGGTLERFTTADNLLAEERVIEIIFKCSRALDYAFHQGVTHRDIKPANILLVSPERQDIKLSDFGSAVFQSSDATQISGVGSPAYMSPQQIREVPLNHQTDIYSLGVVMYQLLAGRLPFESTNNYSLLYRIANEEAPPPSHYNPQVPPHLDSIVARAMRKDLEQRYRSWSEFSHDLAQAYRNRSTQQQPAGLPVPEKFELLRGMAFFREFSDVELWEVLRIAQWSSARPDTFLMREGEPGDSFSFVAAGEARVQKGGKLLGILTAGECFGEMALFSAGSGTRGANVQAATEVELLTIRGHALNRATDACRMHFYKAFLEVLATRLSLANSRIANL